MKRTVLLALVAGLALAFAHRTEAADTAKMGASSSGTLVPGRAGCRQGQYLAGVSLFWRPQISNLQLLCGEMLQDGGWKGVPAIGNGL